MSAENTGGSPSKQEFTVEDLLEAMAGVKQVINEFSMENPATSISFALAQVRIMLDAQEEVLQGMVRAATVPAAELCPCCNGPIWIPQKFDYACDCGAKGKVLRFNSRNGKPFYGCPNYPECTDSMSITDAHTLWRSKKDTEKIERLITI